jgi:hypothetical protein
VGGQSRLAWAALGFGLAGLASAWNPAAAPFGLLVGLGAAVVAVRALRAGGRRGVAAAGLAAALAAVATALTVLALTAGVGRQAGESSLVPQPSPGEAGKALDEAGAASRAARERARGELERLGPGPGPGKPAQPAPPARPPPN